MAVIKFKCCICKNTFDGFGNNPYPVSKDPDDICCDTCNLLKVLPARVQLMWGQDSEDM